MNRASLAVLCSSVCWRKKEVTEPLLACFAKPVASLLPCRGSHCQSTCGTQSPRSHTPKWPGNHPPFTS
eukprot:3303310-Amphidinium_carterae.1